MQGESLFRTCTVYAHQLCLQRLRVQADTEVHHLVACGDKHTSCNCRPGASAAALHPKNSKGKCEALSCWKLTSLRCYNSAGLEEMLFDNIFLNISRDFFCLSVCLFLLLFQREGWGEGKQVNSSSAAWKMVFPVLCQQFCLEFTRVLTSPLLTDNCIFSSIVSGCELCTSRHWKGAFDHCCKLQVIPVLPFYYATAEFGVRATPTVTNHRAL